MTQRLTVFASRALAAVLCCGILAATPGMAAAQGYEAVIRVNDKAITAYEIEQRALLLAVLGVPGQLEEEARNLLIEERLQRQAAEDLGISLSEDGLAAGLAEYAGRANMESEEFLARLAAEGVDAQTIYDFIEVGLLWREVVRTRFSSRVEVSEDEVDRAIAQAGSEGGARVLLSEIVLPARDEAERSRSEQLAQEIVAGEPGLQAFAAAARTYSVSASRGQSGRIDWLPLERLPPAIRTDMLTAQPGDLFGPLPLGERAIGIFQVRAVEELPVREARVVAVDYAEYLLPGGTPAEAQAIARRIDTCDDLYGVAKGQPPEILRRETRQPSELPGDVASAIGVLDENETSVAIRRGTVQVLLMLCGRTTEAGADLDRAQVRSQLRNRRILSFAEGYLGELRDDAVITGGG